MTIYDIHNLVTTYNLHKNYYFLISGESPSRRVIFDYSSPYLYSNYHTHPSPSEDLFALWFGNNGSGM